MNFTIDDYDTLSPKEAIRLQKELAALVVKEDQFDEIRHIAGVDVSQLAFRNDVPFHAGIVVMSYPELIVLEKESYSQNVKFPYIPGLLAFREAPIIIRALEKVKIKPDIILVDGHGISHPRRLGIACHIGVLTGYPTVGCAKSPMTGKPQEELLPEKGSFVPLYRNGEIVGNLLRTKNKVNPVYVSTGHKVSLKTATNLALNCTTKYRIPEPLRIAHQHANEVRIRNTIDINI